MPQHVLYITVDSIRADRVGFLGYDAPTTPRLDDLAEEGDSLDARDGERDPHVLLF